jgi:hypothetical protein
MVNLGRTFADPAVHVTGKPVPLHCRPCLRGEVHRHGAELFMVPSSTFGETGLLYTVKHNLITGRWSCNCADYAMRHPWRGCKHIKAARALDNEQWFAEHPEYFK